MYSNLKPLNINVISDIHYYSKKVGTKGAAFEKANTKTPSDLLHNEEILNALVNQLANDSESDIVLVSGDVTNNGEPDSHKECIALLKKLQDSGKKVYVITATHDYRDNNQTEKYTENGTEIIETAPREALYDMYRQFGPDDALAVHRQSMSYVSQLCDGYRLLALNDDKNLSGASGFSEELFAWITEQIEKAKKDGQFIVAMTHHPLISPSPFYKIIGGSNMMGEHEKRRSQLADLGVSFILTGHTHIQDISYCYSENGNIFYDITTAAPIAYPGTYRKLIINPAENKLNVKAMDIEADFDFELKGKNLKEHLENKFFGMIKTVLVSAATDIRQLARMVTAFSVNPKLIFNIGWLIKPFAKILCSLKIKHVARLCKKETGLKKSDWASIANESVIDYIIGLVANLYGGDSPYTPDTAYYKITMGICSILDSILKTVGVKISKLVKGANSVRDIVEPLLYNSGIPDEEATLYIYPQSDSEKPTEIEKDNSIKSSKKGPAIIVCAVALIILLLPLILLYLLFGFIINKIKFSKDIKAAQ